MNYPRTVIIEDPKLKGLLEEKKTLIEKGRLVSEDIEVKESEMAAIETEIIACESKADIKDLESVAQEITDRFNAIVKEMDECKQRIYDRMKDQVPSQLKESYDAAKKVKEELDNSRNKIALKVQKVKDKIVPLARKAMAPHLQDKYEDFEGLQLNPEGQIVGSIFSHKDDFEKRFDANLQKK